MQKRNTSREMICLPLENNHYALVKLGEVERNITQAIAEMPTLRKRLEKCKENKPKAREVYEELQRHKDKILEAMNTALLSLLEMELTELGDYTTKLSLSIKSYNLMTPDYSKICAALGNYLSQLPMSNKTTNAAVIGRLMNNVRMGYYPTDVGHIQRIVQGIGFPEGVTTNLLDPCCGEGIALRTLAQGNNCYTYGIELDGYRAEEALARIHRVGFGSYFYSRVSHEAFHIMLLNPPYLSVMSEGGNNTRSEKRFLVESLYHLMYGGLLIYIIPYYRLTADICRVLCDNFTDITVWRFMDDEFKKFKQIAIMGVRQKRCDGSAMVQSLASLALEPGKISELSELPAHRYQLPATTKKVDLFKGAEFNVAELAEQLKRSTSFSRLFEKNKLDSTVKRPLLPLSIGQIGLIGGSGFINGLVECSTPHVIKGRVVKQNTIKKEETLNSREDLVSTTIFETRSNKMIFNILTPDGFLSLSDSGVNNESGDSDNDICLPLGRTVVTANARNVLSDADINTALTRHQSGDWGEVCESDRRANNTAVKNDERILSAYTSSIGDKFWVITEADRSYTTVLLPEDY